MHATLVPPGIKKYPEAVRREDYRLPLRRLTGRDKQLVSYNSIPTTWVHRTGPRVFTSPAEPRDGGQRTHLNTDARCTCQNSEPRPNDTATIRTSIAKYVTSHVAAAIFSAVMPLSAILNL